MKRLDLRKRAAALVWARRVSIRVDGISAELLHTAERYYRARAILDDRPFEGMNTNAIIAYARHNHTNYDDLVRELNTRKGGGDAYTVLKTRANRIVSEALADQGLIDFNESAVASHVLAHQG
jgi:hypothetical protein